LHFEQPITMDKMTRKYPVGIQTFSEIRKGNYVYIDKTDLVWELIKTKYIFLSRPRRFGKSLLTTTLASYFKGQRELFEGLKIMDLETEWEQYPVIHVDLSTAKSQVSAVGVQDMVLYLLEPYIDLYGKKDNETTPGRLLTGLIRRAYEKTGKQVVVLIDEYDAPLLDVLHEEEMLPEFRRVLQEFYQPLKASEAMIKFCFITGITKFSQLSIFSTINNLTNVSLDSKYAAICGITEQELVTDMAPDIAMLAEEYECTPEEMHAKLKQQYDGYRFARKSPDIYNPFSLLKCFNQKEVANYWFDSGTPTFLIRQMQHFHTDVTAMEHIEASAAAFDQPTENMEDALPLLYQSGYITIKDYDRRADSYILSIPNKEVRTGFVSGLIPAYTGLKRNDTQGFALRFWRGLDHGDIDAAMKELKAFLASIPYVEGFKKKLEEVKNYEGFYEYTFWLIFNILNVYAQTQVNVQSSESHPSLLEDGRVVTDEGKAKCAGGRVDFMVQMPEAIYVFELKVNGTAREAIDQINSHNYALPYSTDRRKVVKIGVQFDRDSMSIGEYIICYA